MIYLPIDDFSSYSYYAILNENVIRAYSDIPVLNTNVNYTDYFINSHYLTSSGSEIVSSVPNSIDSNLLTNEVYYRNDFADILLIFVLLCLICFYFPFCIVKRFFKKV